MNKKELSLHIREEALRLGFEACGFAQAKFLGKEAKELQAWLDKGYNAGMAYMAKHFEKRTDPRLLVDNAKTIIVVLLNYYPTQKQSLELPQIAKYAYGNDYHEIVKNKLHELLAYIKNCSPGAPVNGRVFTDSAPVLERTWALQAGLGRIGKNTHLINNQIGSYCFIGEIILDVELEYDKPTTNGCGTCKRCIEACPTKALTAPYVLDANRCLSYHNIESKNSIPEEIQKRMSNRLFGCDICQNVCPSNIAIQSTSNPELQALDGFLNLSLEDWKKISEEEFNSRFKHSPLKRAGYSKIMETIDILLKNKED